MSKFDRRNFIKTTSLTAAFASSYVFSSTSSRKNEQMYMGDFSAPKLNKIKAAFLGVGYRGKGHLKLFASLPGTEVVGISDLYEENILRSNKILESMNISTDSIKTYWGNDKKWKKMLSEVRPDIVFISTDWNSHGEMAVETMKNGAHAFVEVPLAMTIKELWDIVAVSYTHLRAHETLMNLVCRLLLEKKK